MPDFERADRIGEFWGYPESRAFPELLIGAKGVKLALRVEDALRSAGTEGADQLVLQIGDAYEETGRSMSARVRLEPSPAHSRPRRRVASSSAS
jgi:hypothetical protein